LGLAPRFGFAFTANDKSGWETVLRGGLGVYYDLGSGTAGNGWPFGASVSYVNVPFPVSFNLAARPIVSSSLSLPTDATLFAIDPKLKLPYSLQWNVAVEQSIGPRQTLSLTYLGSAGRRLLLTQTLNQRPGLTTADRPNPDFGTIISSRNAASSDYNAFQAMYRVRFYNGFQALASYSWSHAIDDVSSDVATGIFDRGNGDFDVRHNLSAAISYDLPKLRRNSFLKALTSDWQLNSIVHVQTGRPINLSAGPNGVAVIDGQLIALRPDYVAGADIYIEDPTVPGGRRFNPTAFTDPPSIFGMPVRQGTFGRNVLRELPLAQLDMALNRSFVLKNEVKLRLQAEVFNVFNNPMFGGFGSSLTLPTKLGVPTQTLNASLGGLNPVFQLGGPRMLQLSVRISF
jgi:hypothetical protein